MSNPTFPKCFWPQSSYLTFDKNKIEVLGWKNTGVQQEHKCEDLTWGGR